MWKNLVQAISDRWQRFLKQLAKDNKEMFPGGKADCCELNRSKARKPPTQHRRDEGKLP